MLVFAALLGFSLSFVVCADVIGRVVFNSPLQGTPEMVSSAIVIICFMQAPSAIRSGGMIHMDFVVIHLPARWQSWFAALSALLGAAFFAFILWGGYDPAWYAWSEGEYEGEGALRVPTWPARLTIVIACALATLNYLLIVIRNVRAALAGNAPTLPPQQA